MSQSAPWHNDHSKPHTIFFCKPDDPYGYLCQWYLRDMTDETGQTFNCCEQYMMYHKALTFNDTPTMSAILSEKKPAKQKALGRQVRGFTAEAWDRVKYDVAVRGNMLKFAQCDARASDGFVYPPAGIREGERVVGLREVLLATGECELAEASRFDRVWGIGFGAEEAGGRARMLWGENLLGRALMEVRGRLRGEGVGG